MVFSNEQEILNLIKLSVNFNSVDFKKNEQIIKELFFYRKYREIFENQSLLPVYAALYTPSRALCFHDIFIKNEHLKKLLLENSSFYCLGAGCGSELIAISRAFMEISTTTKIKLHIQDLANYEFLLDQMNQNIRKYWNLNNDRLELKFSVEDVLEEDNEFDSNVKESSIITACFLLNELLSTSKQKFVKLVYRMLKNMKPGTLLLVVDSAGSFSDVEIAGNTYNCWNLLDNLKDLECITSSDSVWYRFPTNCKYPTKLNNIRSFVRLYRKN